MDTVAFDGMGRGEIFPARMASPRLPISSQYGVVIGAPTEDWSGVEDSGQASLVLSDSSPGAFAELLPPLTSTYAEGLQSPGCSSGHAYAWDLQEERSLGAAMTFLSLDLGGSFSEYRNVPLLAAPTAGSESGRVMVWDECSSCAFFPRPDGVTSELGGRFGTSLGVGIVSPDQEVLFVGSPTLGDGQVSVIGSEALLRWSVELGGLSDGERECPCEFDMNQGNSSCIPWDATLAGAFAGGQFGAALAVGDLDCDGIDELAVGAPGAALPMNGPGLIPAAGAAHVYRASDGDYGLLEPTVLRQGSFEVGGVPESGDRFGQTLVFGNFNGARRVSQVGALDERSCFDLVVAAPGEDEGAGELQLFLGSPQGLTYGGPIIRLDDIFEGSSDPGDGFGTALSAGDLDQDGFDDLIVGAPGDALGGSVVVIPGSEGGLDLERAKTLKQGLAGFGGVDELGDQFGYAVSWTNLGVGSNAPARAVLVGVPGEDGSRGEVRIFRMNVTQTSGPLILLEDSEPIRQSDILGDTNPGDRFGGSLMPVRAFPSRPWAL